MRLIVFIIIIVGIVSGVYLVQQRTNFLPKASSPYKTAINNVSDLDKTLNELGSTDVNQLDKGISDNNSDASAF